MTHKKITAVCMVVLLALPAALAGQNSIPKESNPRLDAKGSLRGSGFRITMVRPMRGDFREYDKLEIAKAVSEIGERVSAEEMERYTQNLVNSFTGQKIFREIKLVDAVELTSIPADRTVTLEELRALSPVPELKTNGAEQVTEEQVEAFTPSTEPAPAGRNTQASAATAQATANAEAGSANWSDLAQAPAAPLGESSAIGAAVTANRTMVITTQVIYNRPGSRVWRAVGFGGGYHRFVVRFRIYDKELKQELAMGIISGEVNTSFGSLPLVAGDSDGRNTVVSAIVNRVAVRKAKSDQ